MLILDLFSVVWKEIFVVSFVLLSFVAFQIRFVVSLFCFDLNANDVST